MAILKTVLNDDIRRFEATEVELQEPRALVAKLAGVYGLDTNTPDAFFAVFRLRASGTLTSCFVSWLRLFWSR